MPASSVRGNLHIFPEPRLDRLYETLCADAFEWLRARERNSIHAVITDPPYGLLEYTEEQKTKLRSGRGGVWRIPPSFDGCKRRPLPRFTILKESHKADLEAFFSTLAALLLPVLVPGAHVFIATNPLVSQLLYSPFIRAGFEKRGEIIRVVHTLRGGRPPQECTSRILGRVRDAAIMLGAVGFVPQAVRGSRPRQPSPVENRRAAPDFRDNAVP